MNRQIYAVVRYPKKIDRNDPFGVHIYSKTSSNLEKMIAYYEEQKARHIECNVALVTTRTAKMMKETYYHFRRPCFQAQERVHREKWKKIDERIYGKGCEEE